jgi:glycosyltransferase involved in cell wall biosynthesis
VRRFPAARGDLPALVRRRPRHFALERFPIHELNLLRSLTGSDALLERLVEQRDQYRWIFFLYAFPLSFFGAMLAGERGYLIPCLHDEPYARYSTTRHLLRTVRHVLANSDPEAALIRELAGIDERRCSVVGEGIDLRPHGDGERFRRERGLDGKLVYFTGRRDFTKNFPLLLAYAEEYWARHGPRFKLMVSGPGRLDVPHALRSFVVDLGYLSVEEKHAAYAAADLFCNPSLLESFSIVIAESWLQGTPVLVHGDCAVTVDQCRRSGGGLWFKSYGEFDAALSLLLARPDIARRLGAQGREWVNRTCRWEDVVRRFTEVVYGPGALACAS